MEHLDRPNDLVGRGLTALVLAIVTPCLLLVGCAFLLPHEVFWITDSGNRFLQVQSFERVPAPEIFYPAHRIDPSFRFVPRAGHHFQEAKGRIVSYYLPYFALLTGPFYRALGGAGLAIVPIGGLIFTLALFPFLLAEVGLTVHRAWACWGLAIATPLFFYGLTFWEHTLAVFLVLAASLLFLVAARTEGRSALVQAFVGGLLMGLSTTLREEGYVLTFALLFGLLWVYRRLPVVFFGALGWLVVVGPTWWLQEIWYGSPFGVHIATYAGLPALAAAAPPANVSGASAVLAAIFTKLSDASFFLFRFHPDDRVAAALAVPFVAVVVIGLLPIRRRANPATERGFRPGVTLVVLAVGTLASAALLVALLGDGQGVFGTLSRQGLLPHSPFLLFGAVSIYRLCTDPRPAVRFLSMVVLAFTVVILVPLHRADVGIVWGPRHFLDIYPFLVALSVVACRDLWLASSTGWRRATVLALAAVCALLGVMIEAKGLDLLRLKTSGTERLLAAVRGAPSSIVISDGYWVPEELAALYGDHNFLEVTSDAELCAAFALLGRNGVGEATVVASRRYGHLSASALRQLAGRARYGQVVATPGLEFMDAVVMTAPVGGCR